MEEVKFSETIWITSSSPYRSRRVSIGPEPELAQVDCATEVNAIGAPWAPPICRLTSSRAHRAVSTVREVNSRLDLVSLIISMSQSER
jgi:hypothetical protein